MLFLQTKFVKCKKNSLQKLFCYFYKLFFTLTNFRLYFLKKIGYTIKSQIDKDESQGIHQPSRRVQGYEQFITCLEVLQNTICTSYI